MIKTEIGKKLRHFLLATYPTAGQFLILYIVYTCIELSPLVYYQEDNADLIYSPGFALGSTVGQLIQHGVLRSPIALTGGGQAWFYAWHSPGIPLLMAVISAISTTCWVVNLVKNICFNGIMFYALYHFFTRLKIPMAGLAVILLIILGPQFIWHCCALYDEEGMLIQLLVAIFAWQLSLRQDRRDCLTAPISPVALWGMSLANSFLFLIKTPLGLLAAWNVVAIGLATRKITAILPAALLLTGVVLGWGSYVFCHTGQFRIGSSFDGACLWRGHSDYALAMYPTYSIDLIDDAAADVRPGSALKPVSKPLTTIVPWHNEWELNDNLENLALTWIKDHPRQDLELSGRKLFNFFLEVRDTPIKVDQFGISTRRRYIYHLAAIWLLFNRCLFFLALMLSARRVLDKKTRKDARTDFLIFFGFTGAYALPYIIAWNYERQVLPTLLPTALFLLMLLRQTGKLPDPPPTNQSGSSA